MEECHKRKRVRDDSEADSPESSKHLRVDPDSDANSSESPLTPANSGESSDGFELGRVEPVLDSSEIQNDLLNMFNDAENVTERDPTMQVQDLDSVMKSFEEEILAPGPNPNPEPESGEFRPNLGYLLEASDDELGLPPTVAPIDEMRKPELDDSGRVGPEGLDLTGFLGFEDDINYDGFGLVGFDGEDNGGGYVTIDGLFDYADLPADILWRSESLQAM